jgi:formamidopyrimidine-DNA glycosylase
MIEVELYRRAADRAVGRRVGAVSAPDAWFLKRGLDAATAAALLEGSRIVRTRRIGKLLLLDTTGVTVGLRFGMTGRLVLDGAAAIEALEYGSDRDDPAWDRFALVFDDGSTLRVNDPRRLGGVEVDPDTSALGPDALAVTASALRRATAGRLAPLKAVLLDQSRVAGLGNLLVDEILWRAAIDPARPAGSLDAAEVVRLHRRLRSTVAELLRRGGSHLGRIQDARIPGGTCPRDGTPFQRRTIGGRTTYSCPTHQR